MSFSSTAIVHRVTFVAALLLALALPAGAASPASGTLSDTNRTLTFTAGPFFIGNQTAFATGDPVCSPATPCDDFTINVVLPADYATTHPRDVVSVKIEWTSLSKKNDYDLFLVDKNGAVVKDAATSSDPEIAIVSAGSGSYQLIARIVPFLVSGETIQGTVTLSTLPDPPAPGTGIAPRYKNYAAPNGLATDAGEPSIGANWKTGNILFQAYTETLRVNFDDATSPARSNWSDVASQITSITSLDPILFTDRQTGRTFSSQLAGATSLMAFTDDDGDTWTPSQGGGIGTLFDHQTVGGGPWATATPGGVTPLYPNSVYYCAHDDASAQCAVSRDGGVTFGPGTVMYTLTDCGGLHGHIKVGPDGTAYLPNGTCSGGNSVVVSEDNGLTWEIRKVPGSSTSSGNDPSVAIGPNNTVYLGYQNGDGHVYAAVSHDHGRTWQYVQDIGAQQNVMNGVFPVVTSGDDDRAAIAFLGTTTPGDYQDTTHFQGVWHLYVATTYNGGQNWVVVDATPDDPVQRGSICNKGTLDCGGDRNLLDFMDITADKEGRVLVGYADGCINACVQSGPNTFSALGTIARQSGGRRLLAKFDPVEPNLPGAPLLSATKDASGVHLTWPVPDDSASAITNYKIYRGTAAGAESLYATIAPKNYYDDASILPNTTYYYRVSAVNSLGEGGKSNEAIPVPAPVVVKETPCTMPGVKVSKDGSGDQTGAPANAQSDIQWVAVAEPFTTDGSQRLVFTIKVADLTVVPPNGSWKILFASPNGKTYFVDMNTFDPSGIRYEYGHIEVDAVTGVQNNVTDGTLDAGSGYSADGSIVLVIANSKVGNPQGGQALGGVSGTTQLLVGATRGLLETIDSSPKNNYVLVGNAACRPNNAPFAMLTATPSSGYAPLSVAFDGSASNDPDAGDGISSYTFDFGDGTASVTQTSPTTSHTYTTLGTFTASLRVKDAVGALSDPSTVVISVSSAPPSTASSVSGGGFFDAAGKITFNFKVASDKSGSFSYDDVVAGVSFDTTTINSYSTSGTCATFVGSANLKSNGGQVNYRVTACDNGQPGRGKDTFAIDVTGAKSVSHSGAISGGNIQLKSK